MATLKEPTKLSLTRAITITAMFSESLQRIIKDPDMTAPQLNLLLQLYLHGSIMQIDLPKYTQVLKSANSRNIAKLGGGKGLAKGRGWVTAEADVMDRRSNSVRLTPEGRALMEAAARDAAKLLATYQQ